MERFVETFNRSFPERQFMKLRQLPENDHDFVLDAAGAETYVELTELVDRTFTFPMSPTEYDAGRWTHAVLKVSGEIPWRVDTDRRDQALTEAIASKAARYTIMRNYPLWLVVFATFHYETEYITGGQLMVSEGLARARRHVAGQTLKVFDEVWFTDLELRPIKVWPHDA